MPLFLGWVSLWWRHAARAFTSVLNLSDPCGVPFLLEKLVEEKLLLFLSRCFCFSRPSGEGCLSVGKAGDQTGEYLCLFGEREERLCPRAHVLLREGLSWSFRSKRFFRALLLTREAEEEETLFPWGDSYLSRGVPSRPPVSCQQVSLPSSLSSFRWARISLSLFLASSCRVRSLSSSSRPQLHGAVVPGGRVAVVSVEMETVLGHELGMDREC